MFTNAELTTHMTRLSKFAYKLTQNSAEAEDLLQSTLLRAIEKQHLFRDNTNLYSWLSKIMYNLFVTGYRRKVKFETQYDPDTYLEKQFVEADQDKKMEVQDVEEAMQQLSNEHQEILILVCVQGMQYADVAEKLGVPVGTVRSRLSRARENLQQAMKNKKNLQSNMVPAEQNQPETLRLAA